MQPILKKKLEYTPDGRMPEGFKWNQLKSIDRKAFLTLSMCWGPLLYKNELVNSDLSLKNLINLYEELEDGDYDNITLRTMEIDTACLYKSRKHGIYTAIDDDKILIPQGIVSIDDAPEVRIGSRERGLAVSCAVALTIQHLTDSFIDEHKSFPLVEFKGTTFWGYALLEGAKTQFIEANTDKLEDFVRKLINEKSKQK